MGYSTTIIGIIGAVALPALVQWGFSSSCSNEIVANVAPLLAALPGAATAWYGRYKVGGITVGGFRKRI